MDARSGLAPGFQKRPSPITNQPGSVLECAFETTLERASCVSERRVTKRWPSRGGSHDGRNTVREAVVHSRAADGTVLGGDAVLSSGLLVCDQVACRARAGAEAHPLSQGKMKWHRRRCRRSRPSNLSWEGDQVQVRTHALRRPERLHR